MIAHLVLVYNILTKAPEPNVAETEICDYRGVIKFFLTVYQYL